MIKETFFKKVKILKNDGENFYWFTVKNTFPRNILFCVAYIPPEGRAYSNLVLFHSLEDDIINLSNSDESGICLMGDFDAHTKN